jgi:hypothetical protein
LSLGDCNSFLFLRFSCVRACERFLLASLSRGGLSPSPIVIRKPFLSFGDLFLLLSICALLSGTLFLAQGIGFLLFCNRLLPERDFSLTGGFETGGNRVAILPPRQGSG